MNEGAARVRLSEAEAGSLGRRALRSLRYSEEEAGIIADHLVDAALCGYTFAGLPRILAIAENPKTHAPRQPIRTVHETEVSALVDGGNNVGYLAAYRGMELAIAKARARRFALVGVHNSYFSGRNAYYLERIARADLVGVHTASGPPRVVPPGGKRPALGTNPLAVGIPTENGPYVFDIGTSSAMWGEVSLLARLGEPMPEGTGIDGGGRPTRDAKAVLEGGLLPFGGHKGYGLSVTIQALGLLAGTTLPRGDVRDYSFLFIVLDPGLLLPAERYKREVTALFEQIKGTPRQDGVAAIRIPSERAFAERERRRREGIELEQPVVDALEALARDGAAAVAE